MPTTYLLLFTANLAFILTNLYGWLLKWFYRPQAYNENFLQLFPAYRAVGMFYLLQVLELPYLLHIGQPDALLYANAFSLLLYPPLMLLMCSRYFFPESPNGPAQSQGNSGPSGPPNSGPPPTPPQRSPGGPPPTPPQGRGVKTGSGQAAKSTPLW